MDDYRKKNRRRTLAAAAVVTAIGLLSACAGNQSGTDNQNTQEVALSLDWSTYVPYHAPFAVASEEGIWEEYGLEISETLPGGSGDAAVEVGTGKTDLAWIDLSTASASMLQGVPITAVAKVQDKNASGLTVLKDTRLESAKDAVGLRIGSTPGGSDSTLIGAFLNANGITENEVTIVNLPSNGKFPALMTGEVDAISGQVYFYTSSAIAEGKEAHGLSFSDMGLNVLDHGFVANDSFRDKNPEAVTDFLAAYKEALQWTIDNQSEACGLLVSKSDGEVVQDACETQLELWLPLTTEPNDPQWGESAEREWIDTVETLTTYGDASGDRDARTMYTNELLPNVAPS
ncbi:ABC transporter substrate-binding protein [Brevibacterium luteolum]|uniref:ABC transporter substrate-binding protein n=1 Tax=Brevibacterium luteolum TaxID=199591 RepID=UPI00223A81A4|nr:ABC transporter substrate-binding protein [Brevibacterium luteolum]MCT1657732.1 ABC transporter substrate-binding protein [Brevibacterium luteolum]